MKQGIETTEQDVMLLKIARRLRPPIRSLFVSIGKHLLTESSPVTDLLLLWLQLTKTQRETILGLLQTLANENA